MSAFGQAGFGSRNRRNQLRSQGQMDPYGQQVRAAKQAPTFNVYQTQGTQQAAGQQQAQSQSQPTQQPAAAQPSAPAMPAYSPSYSSGTAQPIQPQSQGTPYGADPGYADRVAAAAQQWNSTPAGSQKVDWEGNSVRRGLAEGYSLDMITRGLGNTGRFAADPEGAAKFANQVEQDWIASLSSGLPQKPGPNATASEVSAYFNASEAYGRQQKAQQARDERIAAEAAFNDPARSAAGWRPSGEYYNSRGQRFNGIIRNPSSAYRMDASGNLVPYSTQATPGSSSGTPGQAQPIQPQSQGTTYQSQPMLNDRPMRSIEDDMAADREYERQNGWWAQESARRGIDQSTGAPLAGRTNEQATYADFVSRPQPIGPEPPQFNFDTSRPQAQQDQLMQQSNAAVYKALRRDSSQGNQSPMVSGANDRLRRMLSQNMMLDTWRKKQQAGG